MTETLSIILKAEHRFKVYENRALRRGSGGRLEKTA
jgi:hypothetical protein